MIETLLTVYFSIAGVHLFATGFWLMGGQDVEEVDDFWDWIIYNLLWIWQPIKAIIKFFAKNR